MQDIYKKKKRKKKKDFFKAINLLIKNQFCFWQVINRYTKLKPVSKRVVKRKRWVNLKLKYSCTLLPYGWFSIYSSVRLNY